MTTQRSLNFLNYLKQLPSRKDKRALSGQHLPEWADAQDAITKFIDPLPAKPSLLGGTIRVGEDDDKSQVQSHIDALNAHSQAGGIVLLDIHPPSPWAPAGQRHIGNAWVDGSLPKPDLSKLLLVAEDSEAKTVWWNFVKEVVKFFKALRSDSVIIFRPFHEANGEHFWWGFDHQNGTTQEQKLKALTDDLRRVFEYENLNNVLWMHCGAGASWYAPNKWGRVEWVDIVGATVYHNEFKFIHPEDYQDLLATKKPIILGEVGPDVSKPQPGNWDSSTITRMLKTTYPKVVGWQGWHGWDINGTFLHVAPTENLKYTELYNNTWTVNLTDLPDF